MIEIKFRGKRVDNGEWVYGYYFKKLNTEERIISIIRLFDEKNGGHKDFEVIPETVGQYTDIKDKNEKEAYEGDIYWCDYEYSDGTHKYGYRNLIRDIQTFEPEDEFVIIGNIHENPELLI